MARTIRYQFSERSGSNYGERRGGREEVKGFSRESRRQNDDEAVKEGLAEYINTPADE